MDFPWSGEDNPVLLFHPFETNSTFLFIFGTGATLTDRIGGEGFQVDLKARLPVQFHGLAQPGLIGNELLRPALLLEYLLW